MGEWTQPGPLLGDWPAKTIVLSGSLDEKGPERNPDFRFASNRGDTVVLKENPELIGSHGYCARGSNRGHLCPFKKPTIDSKSESIVATSAISIGRAAPTWSMAHFHDNASFGSHADRARVPTGTCGKRGLFNV